MTSSLTSCAAAVPWFRNDKNLNSETSKVGAIRSFSLLVTLRHLQLWLSFVQVAGCRLPRNKYDRPTIITMHECMKPWVPCTTSQMYVNQFMIPIQQIGVNILLHLFGSSSHIKLLDQPICSRIFTNFGSCFTDIKSTQFKTNALEHRKVKIWFTHKENIIQLFAPFSSLPKRKFESPYLVGIVSALRQSN